MSRNSTQWPLFTRRVLCSPSQSASMYTYPSIKTAFKSPSSSSAWRKLKSRLAHKQTWNGTSPPFINRRRPSGVILWRQQRGRRCGSSKWLIAMQHHEQVPTEDDRPTMNGANFIIIWPRYILLNHKSSSCGAPGGRFQGRHFFKTRPIFCQRAAADDGCTASHVNSWHTHAVVDVGRFDYKSSAFYQLQTIFDIFILSMWDWWRCEIESYAGLRRWMAVMVDMWKWKREKYIYHWKLFKQSMWYKKDGLF